MISKNSDYNLIHFNNTRPIKKITKKYDRTDYRQAFNAGLLHFIKSALITLKFMIIYPYYLFKYKPQVVHICGASFFVFWESTYYIFVAKIFRMKTFLHFLGAFDLFYNQSSTIGKFMIRYVLKKVDTIGVLSYKIKNIILELIVHNRVKYLPSTVQFSKHQSKDKFDWADDDIFRILFVGGSDPVRKGLFDIVNSIPIVAEECKNINVILAGGDNINKVRSIVEEKHLSEYVNYWGWIEDKEKIKLYNSCDILLLPSYNEGLPYVIIESLASGLPIIASNVGGIPEAVENGKNGFIVNPGDINAIAHNIVLLCKSLKIRNKMSHFNIIKAKNEFSFESVSKKIFEIYKY
tara:strand:+ start:1933 stop:2982 length:1050 start_codon:yes stop_codon:yes gene_type:complete